MTRPATLPEWNTTEVNSIEPDQDHKDQGWLAPGGVPEKPPFQTFNFWQNNVYKWVKHLDDVNLATVANISGLRALDPTEIKQIIVLGYYVAGDGGGGPPRVGVSGQAPGTYVDNDSSIIVPNGGDGSAAFITTLYGSLSVGLFGAVPGSDSGAFIQDAIDFANGMDGITGVSLDGIEYESSIPINVKNGVILHQGRILYTGSGSDLAIISMGTPSGDNLVRNSGIVDVRAKVPLSNITSTGLVGFQINNYVRSSWIKTCAAEMNGDLNNIRNHVGFEILANRIAASSNAGTYQNTIRDCLALFANTGYRIATAGTPAEAIADPQANGNYLRRCAAYSCRERALLLDHGSQENICEIRADAFPNAVGLGTTVNVVDVEGRYNEVHCVEEVGTIADTQYTVRLGDEAIYNQISASTQQVVTGFLDDSVIADGKRAKNIVRQTGPALINKGRSGGVVSETFYGAIAAAQTQLQVKRWIAPAKCVVSKVSGRLDTAAPTGGDTRIYFAKNSVFSTTNRVTWSDSEAVSVKSINTDTSASVDINDVWVLDEGEFITFAVDTPSGGGVTVAATMDVLYI